MSVFSIRPAPAQSSPPSNPFIVHLAPQVLLRYSLSSGAIVNVEAPNGELRALQIAKSPDKNIKDTIIQMTNSVQQLYGLNLQSHVKLLPQPVEVRSACSVVLVKRGSEAESPCDDRKHWAAILKPKLLEMGLVSAGLLLEDIRGTDGEKNSFKVVQVNNSAGIEVFRLHSKLDVSISSASDANRPADLSVSGCGIGGLQKQLKQLNRYVSKFSDVFYDAIPRRKPGILLHGCSGTGKSLLLESVMQAGWRAKIRLSRAVTKPILKQAFADAVSCQPAVITIHNLTTIAGNASQRPAATLVDTLLDGFEAVQDAQVLVIAACRAPIDIHQDLRSRHYFATEIEIQAPDTVTRAAILKIHSGISSNSVHPILDWLATQTHGCVGADLVQLLDDAADEAEERFETSNDQDIIGNLPDMKRAPLELVEDDYLRALSRIRPTALKEIFVETPQVCWSDVAGQVEAKQYLEEAIMWPFKYAKELPKYGIRPSSGLLLYGPPGCSKTMIAKAAATESRLNFIAVKGAELLNMYVGETERCIRNLFAKARAASPCIIFFDEMEAIATSRTNSSSQNGGLHTVTTLLNELDGITSAKGVFVLGATNQPNVIDDALLRPGRLDRSIYIGPPDAEARHQILQKQTLKMRLWQVDLHEIAILADGMSGAEVVELCQIASRLTFRERIRTGEDQNIQQEHFIRAIADTKLSITNAALGRYRAFEERNHE